MGYPKDSFWKHMWPSWDYKLIANFPRTALSVLAINAALIFFIYVVANSKLLKSIKPIVNGIQSLPMGESVYIKEKGLLSELAMNINKTSEILQSQNNQLRRNETARANWIAGVSHDIRTPLSMVMGYAGWLKEDKHLTDDARRKAAVIVKQSERMQNLINDLNLASKLEYNMQPVRPKKENMIAIVRQVVADYINMDIDDKYPIMWENDEALTFCPVNVDRDLMKRAIGNLIQNSIHHNEQGCNIYVSVTAQNGQCTINVADDGIGATDEQIEKLSKAPHYMVCDENVAEQRHGLGLLIVKQIIAAHGGSLAIAHSSHGGFRVRIALPIQEN
ncbi:MAG: HAMP domain-containing histidine kinase [Candidatus Gastranaerophilales bacterium]|nr:HAMP domain-containing histidine kinase [Candidatus Gastranaerophilales bacterium]